MEPLHLDTPKEAFAAAEAFSALRVQIATGEARRIRQAAGLTQADLAALLGTGPETISFVEGGRRTMGRARMLQYAHLLAQLAKHVHPEAMQLVS